MLVALSLCLVTTGLYLVTLPPVSMREVYFNVMRHRFTCEFDPAGDTAYRQRILEEAFAQPGVAGVAMPV